MKKLFTFLGLLICLLLPRPAAAQGIIYVNAGQAGGNHDGSSWEDAFDDLQAALAIAGYGDTMWVAQGLYLPTQSTFRTISFNIKNGVKMFGGFAGTESSLDERDWEIYETILSGDIGMAGDSTDNSYTVVYCNMADSTTVLDGFIIREGNANNDTFGQNTDRTKSGGGMYIIGSTQTEDTRPRIVNCTFASNNARFNGGGVFIQNSNNGGASPLFVNCHFKNNTSANGGGVYINGGSESYEITIRRGLFDGNASNNGGGLQYFNNYGIYDVVVESCSFKRNFALAEGGAIDNQKSNIGSMLKVLNSDFEENVCNGEGLAISALNFSTNSIGIYIANCFFDRNSGNGDSIISLFEEKNTSIESSIFGNSGDVNKIAINVSIGFVNINNCSFYDLTSSIQKPTVATIESFPSFIANLIFTNCTFYNNKNPTGKFIASDVSSELTFKNCIFYKNEVANGNPLIDNGNSLNLSHCLFDLPDCSSISNGPVTCGPGMLFDADPMFFDTAANDFRLRPCSPARNAGDNAAATGAGLLTDIAGNARIIEGRVDMGAHETPRFGAFLDSVGHVACHGESTGSVAINAAAGCGPFSLSFFGVSTFADSLPVVLDGLPAGTFQVIVNDSDSRADTLEVTVSEPPLLTASAAATAVDCGEGSFGSAAATVGGGSPFNGGTYSIAWDGEPGGSSTSDLPAGPHALIATDSLGCTAVDSFLVEATGGLEVTAGSTDISCHPDNGNGADGTATAAPSGLAPYTWQWQDGQTTETIGMLSSGEYSATVTDALGCTGTAVLTLTAPDPIGLSIEAPDIVCFGAEDGTAAAVAEGGTFPYSFEWGGGETDSLLTGIAAGIYIVTLTDGNGCTAEGSAEINQPPPIGIDTLVQQASGATVPDGSILVNGVSGGSPPYSFLWSTGDTAQSLQNLLPGDYALTITDSLGCETEAAFTVDFETAIRRVLDDGLSMEVFPNPLSAGQQARIRVDSRQRTAFFAKLLDVAGKTLWKKGFDVPAGTTSFTLPMPQVAGAYWLAVETAGGQRGAWKLVVE